MNKEVSFNVLTDEETIKKMIGELIQCKEFRFLNKFLKNNNKCDKLTSKELNRLYYVEGYKFAKRNNKTCFERNYYKPVNAKRLSSSKLYLRSDSQIEDLPPESSAVEFVEPPKESPNKSCS